MKKSELRLLTIAFTVTLVTTSAIALKQASAIEQNNTKFHPLISQIATKFKSYSLVDEEPRDAPVRCAIPLYPELKTSKSIDNDTHGKKIYWLYAKQIAEYLQNKEAPVGQALVKESFEPEQDYYEIMETQTKQQEAASVTGISAMERIKPDPGKKHGLFIMTKLDPKTPGTDQGWVYATVGPDYKRITSAGRVQSCMACHTATKNDRQFGNKYNP